MAAGDRCQPSSSGKTPQKQDISVYLKMLGLKCIAASVTDS